MDRREFMTAVAATTAATTAAGKLAQAETAGTTPPATPAADMKPLTPNPVGPTTKMEGTVAPGGELHQISDSDHPALTTNQGVRISDDQNSLRAGARGPGLLEDFIFREKMTHFDHERIPERVVHARGSAAHGYFELTDSLKDISRADIFQRVGERTPLFARFSTVAGNKGSTDLPRDVRGFAVKFYTKEGNWDLVGNNIPVFFIQDAIKFPDLIHSAKQEPDRGFPQAATAHDTFWDFISLTPESMHMIMWTMSDRAIPRSLQMMEGFGVHTFRLVDADDKSTYVKFHWRPKIGAQSVTWDEAVKISGADPDYHRRDLWNSIEAGRFPEWELAVQLFDQDFADKFQFDVLDATKIIPEEAIPLRVIGRMVLDRNPDNFFAETEQVAFCTTHVPPGIDFTNDPLLQGRNFSYLDTQIKRLGGPNFHQIPINRAQCPMANFQRDGHMQMEVPKGRVNYQPNSLQGNWPRESPRTGFRSFPEHITGDKLRARPESFADHFSQARQFFISQTKPEQDHIVAALTFELSKVQTAAVRMRLLGQLANIGEGIADRVAAGLGYTGTISPVEAAAQTQTDLAPSPPLSILAKAKPTFAGRTVGALVSDGADADVLAALKDELKAAGGTVQVVAVHLGGVTSADGKQIEADRQLAASPSALFDAVALIVSDDGVPALLREAAADAFVRDAYAHCKVIGFTKAATPMMQKAGFGPEDGVMRLTDVPGFVKSAAQGRIWAREPKVRPVA